jgi:hypothetical protein
LNRFEESAFVMMGIKTRLLLHWALPAALLAFSVSVSRAAQDSRTCRRVRFEGELSAGHPWQTSIGQGWIFRALPVSPPSAGYSGWDLVVDRDPPAGYPDALLLATLPYNSLNEREIATTFGLRAQDAIGWNPRTFHFLTNASEFRQAQQWFRQLMAAGPSPHHSASARSGSDLEDRLLQLQSHASSGQLQILDARIVPGIADPRPFAQMWAQDASRTPHEIEQAPPGQATSEGKLMAMRFALTLWLPQSWNLPSSLRAVRERCPE